MSKAQNAEMQFSKSRTLKALRMYHRESFVQCARRLSVNVQTISRWENGVYDIPTAKWVLALRKYSVTRNQADQIAAEMWADYVEPVVEEPINSDFDISKLKGWTNVCYGFDTDPESGAAVDTRRLLQLFANCLPVDKGGCDDGPLFAANRITRADKDMLCKWLEHSVIPQGAELV